MTGSKPPAKPLIAANAPLAVRASKQIIRESRGWPWHEAFARQSEFSEAVRNSADAPEGALAFTERRPPVWRGE